MLFRISIWISCAMDLTTSSVFFFLWQLDIITIASNDLGSIGSTQSRTSVRRNGPIDEMRELSWTWIRIQAIGWTELVLRETKIPLSPPPLRNSKPYDLLKHETSFSSRSAIPGFEIRVIYVTSSRACDDMLCFVLCIYKSWANVIIIFPFCWNAWWHFNEIGLGAKKRPDDAQTYVRGKDRNHVTKIKRHDGNQFDSSPFAIFRQPIRTHILMS